MPKATTLPRRFMCAECGARFTRDDVAQRHFREKHDVPMLYACPKKSCAYIRPNRSNCARHIRLCHRGRGHPVAIPLSENDTRRETGRAVPQDERVVEADEEEDQEDVNEQGEEGDEGEEGEEDEEREEREEDQGREQGTPPPVAGPSIAVVANLPVSDMLTPPNPIPQSVAVPPTIICTNSRVSPYHQAYAARPRPAGPQDAQGRFLPSLNQGPMQVPAYPPTAAPALHSHGQMVPGFNQGPLQMPAYPPMAPLPHAQGNVFPNFHPGQLQALAYPQIAAPALQPQGRLLPNFNLGAPQLPAYPPTAAYPSAPPRPGIHHQQAAPAPTQTLPIPADLPLPAATGPFQALAGGSWEIPEPRGPWNTPLGDGPLPTLAEMWEDIGYPRDC